jgi:hypothetical protein
MPPPNATICRHSIGCWESVQNLIRAEGVRGRFELGQNPVFKERLIHRWITTDMPTSE